MAAIAQMNKLRISNPYTHNGRITNPAERILLLVLLFLTGLLSSCSQNGKTANKEEGVALGDTIESIVEQLSKETEFHSTEGIGVAGERTSLGSFRRVLQ